MFEQLTEFSKTRAREQAFGFYVAYVAVIVASSALAGIAFSLIFSTTIDVEKGTGIGAVVAALLSGILAYKVVAPRRTGFSTIAYVLSSIALGLIGGALLGMIIPAFLTTRE